FARSAESDVRAVSRARRPQPGARDDHAAAAVGLERDDLRRPVGAVPDVRRRTDRRDAAVRAFRRDVQYRGAPHGVRHLRVQRPQPLPSTRARPVPLPDRPVTQELGAAIPGWYGKLPSLGDFASRRLPVEFVKAWDACLQEVISASRDALGERWFDASLTMPIWRFVFLPGLVTQSGWAGVMMPSVDRVGRHFPLTIAIELPSLAAAAFAAFEGAQWFAGLEEAALAVLDPRPGVDGLDRALGH